MSAPRDLAQIRLDNALLLFDEFVQQAARQPDAATLRGLEGRFAERLQIQASYWSQIKSRSRQIGERLARQFERRMHKPTGWMDQQHHSQAAASAVPAEEDDTTVARSDDERFIVGLVLTYYRRHPERARARLLELLGEVLSPPRGAPAGAARPTQEPQDETLWRRTTKTVAPLKRKR